MKSIQIYLAVLVCLSLSLLAAQQIAPEQVRDALLGLRSVILGIQSTCEGNDAKRLANFLVIHRGCKLSQQDNAADAFEKHNSCIDNLVSAWSSIESQQCKAPFLRATQEQLAKNLKNKWQWVAASNDRTLFETRLDAYLAHLSYWENKTRDPLYFPKDLTSGQALDEFYAHFSQDLNEVHTEIAKGLFEFVKARIHDFDAFDRLKFLKKESPFYIVMKKLLVQDKPGPISLIYFSAMTLQPLLDRSKALLSTLDLNCSLKGACNDRDRDYVDSEVYQTVFLTSLLGQNEIPQELLKVSLTSLNPETWELFQLAFAQHHKLTTALRKGMNNQEIPVQEADLEQFEPLAFQLVSILREAKGVVDMFKNTGRFALNKKEYLGPFTRDELSKVNGTLDRLKTSLAGKLAEYRRDRTVLAQGLRDLNQVENRKENTQSLIESTSLELRNVQLDLQGLQAALRKETNALSHLVTRSNQLIGNKTYGERFASGSLTPISSGTLGISATDAHFVPGALQNEISAYAVSGSEGLRLPIAVKSGDLVTAEITGQYSPICAISKEYSGVQELAGSLTGPEGFIVSASHRQLKARSAVDTTGDRQTEMTSNNFTEHLAGCGSSSIGMSMSVGVSFIITSSMSISASHSTPEDCLNRVTTKSRSREISSQESLSDVSELSQQASFERGMRSRFTPFPAVPVGALVAVEVDPSNGRILQTRVMHRNTVFSVTRDANLYLVVNDCQNQSSNPQQLTVKLTQNRSAMDHSVVGFLMDAVAEVSKKLDGLQKGLVAQGDISASDLAALKTGLQADIGEIAATSHLGAFRVADFPLVDEFIQTWIHSELAQLERRVKIRQAERKLQLLYIKHRELVNQSINIDRDNVLTQMISDWTFRNLDYKALGIHINRLTGYLDARVLPLLNTILPGVAKSESKTFSRFANTADLNTELEEVAQNVLDLVDGLNYAQVLPLIRPSTGRKIVVSFPRTMATIEEATLDYSPKYQYVEKSSEWRTVPHVESARVWNDFNNQNPELSLKVDVNDIYGDHHVLSGFVDCRERAPFVKSMGVYFVVDDAQYQNALNIINIQRRILLPELVSIPNQNGMDDYSVTSESFRMDLVPIRFANGREVQDVFSKTGDAAAGAANGISPIGTFTLQGLDVFYNNRMVQRALPYVEEILLVFEYESIWNDRELTWIPNCARR